MTGKWVLPVLSLGLFCMNDRSNFNVYIQNSQVLTRDTRCVNVI